ncbi:MAG: leucine-rich repeat protein [Paludibacteraceae bacterium]|nr:leucine-rich repeat protein [Paludibacteraceae bacterium]
MKRIFTAFMMMLCAACVASAANYLTFTAEEDSSSFGIVNAGNNPDVQYSLDGGETWTALAAGDTITLAHKGDKALLRGDNPEGFSKSRSQYSTFKMTGKVAASGSVMSLIDGVGLSTEIPNGYCFCRSFRACTSLTRAPELPATTLTAFCYDAMFLGCTNLKQVPTLPATTLANFCYDGMFAGCTSLTQTPELPVTTLASGCYYSMFSDCKSLTQAPALPATTLADSCYMYMFSGCTGLSEIHVSFDDWRNAGYSTAYWVENVAPSGTFICPENLPLEYGANRIPLGWRVKKVIDGDTVDVLPVNRDLLTFTAEEDGSTFGIMNEKNNPNVQYSLNGGETWNALAAGDTITLAHKGDKALLRGNNPEGFSRSRTQYSTFEMTGKVSASGSVMSLIDGVGKTLVVPASFCFHSLFEGCTSLTQAPELPATTLTENCYRAIFSGCTSLTQAPALPATTLAYSCYESMFSGCTSLTQAPKLPATTLAEACYFGMFSSCTSLTQAPELPATTLAYSCYKKMFSSCDLLRQAPELPATTLVSACYQYMFSGCTSLTQAPELPAPELIAHSNVEISCYFGMFSECTNLSEISVAFVKWKDSTDRWEDNTYRWVENVAPTGTFICPKALPLEYGENRIPEGWTVKYIEDMANYLTFTAEEDGSTFGIVNGRNSPNVLYSLDGGKTWTALAGGDTVVLAHKGDKALLKGNNPHGFSQNYMEYQSSFKMTGKIAASGSVMSLIDGTGLSSEIRGVECFGSLFENCTSLTQAPELPAVTLANYCYAYMFRGCTSLTRAPELPATTLADGCYWEMFSGCTSLTQAPELPATTLTEDCYAYMFRGCTSLTQAPALIATKLAGGCYCEMFSGCTSLTQAPALPATTLADACYSYMFSSCTSLTEAPALPATTLANNCYYSMFSGCTSLTKAPNLPAPELPAPVNKNFCYGSMFLNCTNLSEISVAFNVWDDNTSWWVKDVAPTGTFICPKDLPLEYGVSRIPEGWTVKYIEDMPNYLTFTAEEDGSSFGIVNNGGNNPDVRYSLDGGETWTALAGGKMVTLAHKGDKALLKGNNPQGFSKDYDHYSAFKMIGKVAASGSVMSLIDETDLSTEIPNGYCFCRLFRNCTSLTQAPELPATTLASGCYYEMFSNCTSLTQAPELPTTTLANNCYYGMFSDCTSLTQAPELPATTLAEACYYSMFSRCTSLVQAPELPTTTLADYCYCFMFSGCTSLAQAPTLSSMVMVEGCYSYMFSGCTSLTQAPELPATTLPTVIECGCYQGMFSRCTSLTQAPELPATTLANFCYREMFSGCANLTQAPELPATELVFACYESMFSGCTSLTQAPALPATTLADFCYDAMFRGCTSLSQIRVSFDDWNDGLHTDRWVADVAPTGTFICPKTLALEYGEDRIPEGWTVKYIGEEGSGVSSALADDITVWTDGLTVYVCGVEGEVSLYDMSGRIVAVSNSADEERALCVPAKGAYVVRTNGGSSVVLVR